MSPGGVSGLILAGGRSTRLGQDKRSLPTSTGLSQLELMIARLGELVDDVVLALREPDSAISGAAATVVYDERPGAGPLGGICAGLGAARHERVLVIACDLPLLSPAVLGALLAISITAEADLTVPRRADGTLEMLHAVYCRSVRSVARQRLSAGRLKLAGLADDLVAHGGRVRYVAEAELLPLDPGLRTFFNLNTPADLARLRHLDDPGA